MASIVYNAGSKAIADRSVDYIGDVIKVMLIGLATPYVFDRNHAVMTVPAASELSVTGYVPGFASPDRRTLATKTITNDTALNRCVFDAADPAAWTLATGGTVASAIVYKHLTSDAVSVPLFFLDFVDIPTNGSPFTLVFDVNGLGYLQQ